MGVDPGEDNGVQARVRHTGAGRSRHHLPFEEVQEHRSTHWLTST